MKFLFTKTIYLRLIIFVFLFRDAYNFYVEKKYINLEYDYLSNIYLVEEIITYKRDQFDEYVTHNDKFSTWQIKKLFPNFNRLNIQNISSLKVENFDSSIELHNLNYGFRKERIDEKNLNTDKIMIIEFGLTQNIKNSSNLISLKFSYSLLKRETIFSDSEKFINVENYSINYEISNYNTKKIVDCEIDIIIRNLELNIDLIILDKPYSFGYYDEEGYKDIYKSPNIVLNSDLINQVKRNKYKFSGISKVFRIFYIDHISPLKKSRVDIKFKKQLFNNRLLPLIAFESNKTKATFEEYMDNYWQENSFSIVIIIICVFIIIFAVNLIGKSQWSKKISFGNLDLTFKY
jgi:hypothetical protein